jgi:hypothetical protein
MKPFDGQGAGFVKFVGIGYHDNVVIDTPQYGTLRVGSHENLRMVPKKRTVYMNVMEGGPGAWFISAYAANAAEHTYPVIARAVPIEIED